MTGLLRRTVLFATVAGLPGAAPGQSGRRISVGLVSWWTPSLAPVHLVPLREGLKALGYEEGRNLELNAVFTSGDVARTREAVRHFVDRNVDVLVVSATPVAMIAKQETATRQVPVVFAPVSDPLATGLVASIARPGGNLTGMSMMGPDLSGKRLELLREIIPGLRSIAFLGWTRDQNASTFVTGIERAAAGAGLTLAVKLIDDANEIDAALLASLKRDGAEALVVQPIFMGQHERIGAAARAAGLPYVSDFPVFVTSGALLTYGIDDRAQLRRAAYFIDRIVKGTKPADLPVEFPTEYALLINLRTARDLGLTVPPSVIQRAEEVIE